MRKFSSGAATVCLLAMGATNCTVSCFAPIGAPVRVGGRSRSASTSSSTSTSRALFLGDGFLLAQQAAQNPNLLEQYALLLGNHPITTKGVTAAVLACAGDAIAQWRSDSPEYDAKRGASFLVFGALYTGAFQHFWFNYLSAHVAQWGHLVGLWGPEQLTLDMVLQGDFSDWWRYFDIVAQHQNPPSPTVLAAAKVAVNQLVVIPTVYMPLFFAFTGLVSGLTANESLARAQSLYFPLLKRNWLYWLPTQFLQFLVIPPDFQIPFLSAASLLWTVILSSIGGSASAPASPSSIVAYETTSTVDEPMVTVLPVQAGEVNEFLDQVRLEDVQDRLETLVPENLVETAREVVADARTQLATGGFAAGLLASAAGEGAIGAVVGNLIGVEAGLGVAAVAALGASVGGLIAAAATSASSTTGPANSTVVEQSLMAVDRNNTLVVDTDVENVTSLELETKVATSVLTTASR